MAGPYLFDRVKERTVVTGTGTATLLGAPNGFRSFSVIGNGNTTPYVIVHADTSKNEWEVGIGTYTSSGTTLSRDSILASSTGSAIDFTAGDKDVFLPNPAIWSGPQCTRPGGRLTLTTAVPVTTSDVSSAGTLYYTPYVDNRIEVWNGYGWVPTVFSEVSKVITGLTSGKNYDVFGYLSSGVLTLDTFVAWNTDTARTTALTLTDGRYTKDGDKTRLYLGTFRTTGTASSEDSATKRYLWNMYNRLPRHMQATDSTDSWTYSTASWRQCNAGSTNLHLYMVRGLNEDCVLSALGVHGGGGVQGNIGIGIDAGTPTSFHPSLAATSPSLVLIAHYAGCPGLGYHSLDGMEYVNAGTTTFYGDAGITNFIAGINALVQA